MKALLKYLLLLVLNAAVLFLGMIAVSLLVVLLAKTTIGTLLVSNITGGAPDVAAVLVPCIASYFICSSVAKKLGGYRPLNALGWTVVLVSVISFVVNITSREPVASNIITAALGIAFIIFKDREVAK